MNKLDMAHEYAIEMAKQGIPLKSCKELGWKYADAMQAEADKREQSEAKEKREKVRALLNDKNTFLEHEGQHFDDVANLCKTHTSKNDWQPDWTQAPDWANWWSITKFSQGHWFLSEPKINKDSWVRETRECKQAPSFNYQGDWKQSLRKRPQ